MTEKDRFAFQDFTGVQIGISEGKHWGRNSLKGEGIDYHIIKSARRKGRRLRPLCATPTRPKTGAGNKKKKGPLHGGLKDPGGFTFLPNRRRREKELLLRIHRAPGLNIQE